jgi:site-specific recombinase XerD
MGVARVRMSEVVEAYLLRRRSEGYSRATLAAYEHHLRSLNVYLVDPCVLDVSLEQLRSFLALFAHLKPSSLGAKIRALRAFFRWVHEEGLTRGNLAVRLKEPKLAQRVPKHLSVEELELLRDSCRSSFERALIEVFFATGARIGEVQGMNLCDVDWRESSILVLGKGSREREVYFGAKGFHLAEALPLDQSRRPEGIVRDRPPAGATEEYCDAALACEQGGEESRTARSSDASRPAAYIRDSHDQSRGGTGRGSELAGAR